MMTEATTVVTDAELEAQLPKPVGYRLLIALPTVEKTYESDRKSTRLNSSHT